MPGGSEGERTLDGSAGTGANAGVNVGVIPAAKGIVCDELDPPRSEVPCTKLDERASAEAFTAGPVIGIVGLKPKNASAETRSVNFLHSAPECPIECLLASSQEL